jgi:hypothetical protein
MSLEHSPAKHRRTSSGSQHHLHPDAYKVLTVDEWCRWNGFSNATGKRVLKSGNGPKVIQLSSKRIGIRVLDNAEWQDHRARSAS